MKKRELYDKLRGSVNLQTMDFEVKRALQTLDNYWTNYPEHAMVVPGTFLTELSIHNPGMSEEDIRIAEGLVKVMMNEPDEASAKGLIRSLRTLDFATEIERTHAAFQEGHDIDIHQEIKDLAAKFERDISRTVSIEHIGATIDEIIQEQQHGTRLTWFLNCLTGSMPNIRTGMQVIFGARPGKGKTSFCANQAVHAARIAPDGRPVFWFNNEGKGTVIKGTTYRAALGLTFEEIIQLGADEATARYKHVVGGLDNIRIFDIHGRDYKFIERIISDHRPAVVIFDMLDNVHGFGDAARTDLRLEAVYQWAREAAVIYDFMSLPTSQISVEGEGKAWCDQSMLKDSKTAKQGACDCIITMGAVANPDRVDSRYLYVPKTKQTPDVGYRADCVREVKFDGPRCQFNETDTSGPNV